jgi:hypothetical protein
MLACHCFSLLGWSFSFSVESGIGFLLGGRLFK